MLCNLLNFSEQVLPKLVSVIGSVTLLCSFQKDINLKKWVKLPLHPRISQKYLDDAKILLKSTSIVSLGLKLGKWKRSHNPTSWRTLFWEYMSNIFILQLMLLRLPLNFHWSYWYWMYPVQMVPDFYHVLFPLFFLQECIFYQKISSKLTCF